MSTQNEPKRPRRGIIVGTDKRPDRDATVEITFVINESFSDVKTLSRAEAVDLIAKLAAHLAATAQ